MIGDIDPTKLKHRELLLVMYERLEAHSKRSEERHGELLKVQASQQGQIDGVRNRIRKLENWRLGLAAAGAALTGVFYAAIASLRAIKEGSGAFGN